MATTIKFGTSGWRSVIAEEFTFGNVRRAVTGIAKHVISVKPNGARVIVGRDPRTRIAADNHTRSVRLYRNYVLGYSRYGPPYISKRELFRDDASPPGSSELDRRCHFSYLERSSRFSASPESERIVSDD